MAAAPTNGAGAAWREIGTALDHYDIPTINPFDPSYPAWPGQNKALRLLRTAAGTFVVITDGLGSPVHHLGEFFVETEERVEELDEQWQTNLVIELGRVVPEDTAHVARWLFETGMLTVSLEVDGAPDGWSLADDRGNVGVFLGLPHAYTTARPTPVNVKLMRPAELEFVLRHGDDGRRELRDRYLAQGAAPISNLTRPSVV